MTGKIYHIKSYPPESDELKARLVTRPDDTEEKVFLLDLSLAFFLNVQLQTHVIVFVEGKSTSADIQTKLGSYYFRLLRCYDHGSGLFCFFLTFLVQ